VEVHAHRGDPLGRGRRRQRQRLIPMSFSRRARRETGRPSSR
jgi:hypothetical protein